MIFASAPTKMPSRELVEGGVYAFFVTLGIVAVVALCAFDRPRGCSRGNQAYEIAKGVELFKLGQDRYPTAEEGLGVLVTPPKGRAIMEALPKDAWGNDYAYVRPGVMNPGKFDVRSAGADAVFYTDDDVGNWWRE